MADLFEKKGPTSFGDFSAPDVGLSSLSTINNNDPFSAHFTHACKTPKDLVRYLIALQMQRFKRVVDIPMPALMNHVKLLTGQYTIDLIARGVRYAANVTTYPFSFAFVEKKAIPEVLKRCPTCSMEFQTSLSLHSPKTGGKK